MVVPGFSGGTYPADSLSLDAERAINVYPESNESGNGKNRAGLIGCPGTSLFASIGVNAITAIHAELDSLSSVDDRLFAVSGTHLYEIESDGTVTDRGALGLVAQSLPQIASNGIELFIAVGGEGYTFTLATNTLTGPVATIEPSSVVFLDGYFIAHKAGTQEFYISGLYDGSTWSALDVAQAEAQPDKIVDLLSSNGELWVFGQYTTQPYQNTGNASFPFEAIKSGIINVGLVSAGSARKVGNSILWAGFDAQGAIGVYRADGYNARRVSTYPIEQLMQDYHVNSPYSAFAYSYHERGHYFYVLYPVGGDSTLVYDLATEQWHERGLYVPLADRYETHRSRCHAFCFGKHLVGDRSSGKILELSSGTFADYYDDNDLLLFRKERRCPYLFSEAKRVFFPEFRLDCEVGVGLDVASDVRGYSPTVSLSWSDDAGKTYTDARTKKLGVYQQYRKPLPRWSLCGSSEDKGRVLRIHSDDPVKTRWNNLYTEPMAGLH